jgi:diguanylate cyclase (GGDEF)-like protein
MPSSNAQFRLQRYFSLTSAIVTTLMTLAVVFVYQTHQTATLLRTAEDQNVALARSFANTIWSHHAQYLSSVRDLQGDALRARSETAEINRQLREVTKDLPVLKVKIFNLDGLTVYSSEFAQIGESRSSNQGFLKAARAAMPASKTSYRGTFSAFSGVRANVHLAESYVPIVDDAGRVKSVFELYTDITPQIASLQRDTWSAAILAAIAFGGFYLILLLVVRRADIILKRQDRELSAFKALETANAKLDVALKYMYHGLAMFDAEQRLVVCNKLYGELYGLTPEQVKPGTTIRQLLQYRHAKGVFGNVDFETFANDWLSEFGKASSRIQELADGRVISIVRRPMPDGGLVSTTEDITERRRAEARIAHMARHDALTDLPNRMLLNERLEAAVARAQRGEIVAVHVFDLDLFKNVNDTLGHAVGDKLLKAVAEKLRALARETDTIARIGGDEFAIVQVGLEQPADATTLAERVIEAISTPHHIDGHQVIVGTSVGIAVGPTDGVDPGQLMTNADLAMYRAKSEGRGTFRFFQPGMDVRMKERRAMESDLRKALTTNEFELHYQPVVNLETGEISGCEALIRWHHPTRGMVSPGEFIPLAEEIGCIVQLGEWAIREACATAALWPDGLTIAVNLSPAQFTSPGLVTAVVSALASSGLAPERLELEITETVLLEQNEATLATLFQLRELGVRIAMDDFGTGYSSLSYLQKFPFDKIKIDRAFVKDIKLAASSLNIVRAVAAMAKGLGMATTAEGVETQEQHDLVKEEGCTEMQGYLFSKPLPADEIGDLIRSRRSRQTSAVEIHAA